MNKALLTVTRRFAAGIDVSESAVRIVVLSKRVRSPSAVCVEHIDWVALEPGAVIDGEFVDRAAVIAALCDTVERLPQNGVSRALRCAMGLPSSATLTTRVPLTALLETRDAPALVADGDPRGVLEPAVLAEAERISGIERGALAVDWSVETQEDGRAQVAIAATARRHVEARVETAAAAGIALSAIDGEPAAAMRAMRHSGKVELGPDARFMLCWLEKTGLHGWVAGAHGVESEVRYPAPEHSCLADALRDLAGTDAPLDCVYVGGEADLMAQAALPLPALAKMFGCPALPFECAPYCNGVAGIDASLKHSPLFAVAFGLALREVLQ
ncbi:pilus assembly protein PilM [Caballeronia sp. TF1N1]|uniref:pilus assembly protein PilM n=1 Tax=Caballeronia sp. TF1N1 TaxID=2878153 RepID=UPI001FD1920C|nr:pilus assembly protein PilM [Caballeronia sp. TF1N1]